MNYFKVMAPGLQDRFFFFRGDRPPARVESDAVETAACTRGRVAIFRAYEGCTYREIGQEDPDAPGLELVPCED